MSLQLSRSWCPGWLPGARGRLGRCRTPGRRCWRPRRHHWLEPIGKTRMTLCAGFGVALKVRRKASELPAHDGPAGIGKLPSSRLRLMIEVLAGCARQRAEARQGSALEHSFGGEDACHRNVDDLLSGTACQPLCRRRIIAGCRRPLRRERLLAECRHEAEYPRPRASCAAYRRQLTRRSDHGTRRRGDLLSR